jgi:hypothetical protein
MAQPSPLAFPDLQIYSGLLHVLPQLFILLCLPRLFGTYFDDYLLFQAKTGKYIPPHARGSFHDQDTKKQEELKRLRRQMKGLLNRVAENNMNSIASEVRHWAVWPVAGFRIASLACCKC